MQALNPLQKVWINIPGGFEAKSLRSWICRGYGRHLVAAHCRREDGAFGADTHAGPFFGTGGGGQGQPPWAKKRVLAGKRLLGDTPPPPLSY